MITRNEMESVLQQDSTVQFEYFIKRVADFEEIWIMSDTNGMFLLEAEKDKFVLPVWPFKEYADLFREEVNQECKLEAVSIYDFLEEELVSLSENGYDLAIMSIPNKPSIIVNNKVFEKAIRTEMEKYE